MSKKVKFTSQHPGLMVMRTPMETTRSVNGVMQIVKEDQVPFKFDNGDLSVTEEEAEELRAHRHYGVIFEEVPPEVQKVATKKAAKAKEAETKVETKPTTEVKETVVDEVSSYNEAMAYFKDEFGKDHKDVNSKDKISALMAEFNIQFPNYAVDE